MIVRTVLTKTLPIVATLTMGASSLMAQDAVGPSGADRDRDARIESFLKEMPDQTENQIRDALAEREIKLDQSGIPPFTRVWNYQIPNTSPSGIRFDLEGNMIVVSESGGSILIEKYSIASNVTPSLIWSVQTALFDNTTAFELDLDGNIYVAGFLFPDPDSMYVVKVSPHGFINWQRQYENPRTDGSTAYPEIRDIVIDPDGVPFMIMTTEFFDELADRAYIYRIDPVNGAIGFLVDLEAETGMQLEGRIGFVEMDPAGGLYAYTYKADLTGSILTKIDAGHGDVVWSTELDVVPSYDVHLDALEASPLGGAVVAGRIGAASAGVYVDEDGAVDWTFVTAPQDFGGSSYSNAHALRDGSVIFTGGLWGTNPGFVLNLGGIVKVDSSGSRIWGTTVQGSDFLSPNPSLAEIFTDLQVDRVGNSYVQMRRYTPSFDRFYTVHKYSPDGVLIWSDTEPVPGGFSAVEPIDLQVDGGGNVVAVGVRFSPGSELSLVKYTQPYLGVPTIQTASATLSFEDQSIWAPGMGNLVAEEPLFDVDLTSDFSVGGTFDTVLAGEFGGEFVFLTDGVLNTGVRAEIQGGTADVHFPIDIQFGIPPIAKVSIGSDVSIAVDWDVDPAARLTSCFTPTFNAGLTAGVDYSIFSSLRLVAFSEDLINTTFINDQRTIEPDYIPEANLLDILSNAGYPVPGEWRSIQSLDGIFSADFRTPQLFAQGLYDPNTNSFSTQADDRFFRFGVSVTEAILKPFGLTASADFEAGTIGGEFGISGGLSALQLGARVDIGAAQDIDVGLTPMITYDFIGTETIPSQTIPLGDTLTFNVPKNGTFDGLIEIVPTITATADFFNSTDIEMFPGITWKTIEVNGAASAFGFDLIDIGPECLFCYDWDLSEILEALGADPGLTDLAINLFNDGWEIPLQSVTLPCIRIIGSTEPPNLEAASRESLSMVIYDQTSPNQSSFNIASTGSKKFILYGERFSSGTVGKIEHWGRIEALETTFINANTLLVEVPNRFRLLPGVAKLFVTKNTQNSDSIDLSITFPVPRLDAVNPNLWAADPDLAVLPVSVIDAKTFTGNDTFIARRDYYIKMRDDLWSDITDGGFAGGAAEYYPGFDFNKLPEFPSVLWESKGSVLPLPRFVQPVDNGIHNVRLSETQYDVPMMVPVVICNPGPGGGMSNELMLTIAAPAPVTSAVMPAYFSPLDVIMDDNYFDPADIPVARPIELRIEGPQHVPHFSGYEEPKYGNFNAASIVRFNGMDLPTTFISSSLLLADLPASMATLGDHSVTIFTPSNGTQYFEEHRVDANGDGIPDDVPAWQGLVDSGGESAPLLFRVRYRDPVVAEVVPNLIDQDSIAFDDSQFKKPRPFNLTLLGEDFREGAQVFFNGQLRNSLVIESTMVKVKLLSQDVSMIGTFEIVVRNPFPQLDQSAPATITVSDLQLIK